MEITPDTWGSKRNDLVSFTFPIILQFISQTWYSGTSMFNNNKKKKKRKGPSATSKQTFISVTHKCMGRIYLKNLKNQKIKKIKYLFKYFRRPSPLDVSDRVHLLFSLIVYVINQTKLILQWILQIEKDSNDS